jgi:hypothetical protein
MTCPDRFNPAGLEPGSALGSIASCFLEALPGFTMLKRNGAPETFGDYLTIGEAAAVLGVSIETLRNWDRAEKFRPARHPFNGYRLYRREDLESLLRQVANGSRER